MSHAVRTSRQPVTRPVEWGLHPIADASDPKALQGIVRTRHGFVQVMSMRDGTFLEIVLHGWHYTRRSFSGPISTKTLVALANRFAADVHDELSNSPG